MGADINSLLHIYYKYFPQFFICLLISYKQTPLLNFRWSNVCGNDFLVISALGIKFRQPAPYYNSKNIYTGFLLAYGGFIFHLNM